MFLILYDGVFIQSMSDCFSNLWMWRSSMCAALISTCNLHAGLSGYAVSDGRGAASFQPPC